MPPVHAPFILFSILRFSPIFFGQPPFSLIIPLFHKTVETRPLPFVHLSDEAVLYRVEMDVIDVPGKVIVIFNGMFPEPSLPDSRFATFLSGRISFFFRPNFS